MGVRSGVSVAGIGCAASVVVFSAGSNAISGIASGFSGQIPVFQKAEMMVEALNASTRAA